MASDLNIGAQRTLTRLEYIHAARRNNPRLGIVAGGGGATKLAVGWVAQVAATRSHRARVRKPRFVVPRCLPAGSIVR